ncbi:hypothetical protein DSM106972_028090 [Dulcicalothrix desertica PCC 7102]|uniref:Uncharacterized protein n=1 Tax=Dulcicalothrix desertica PCC 7102 TaxID=232991 RepID=A0A433VKK5_9CYAN|nr:hypothetical protein [Dulcicalothrix desertica]RUT06552.1 hypothetical protein DSM106972_028090 [Dulcicalothrix desertica PCC 7102]TWH50333.1 hypothetical protein CAL7102_04632 [Dulcicalothrix desertica PCC 7102]
MKGFGFQKEKRLLIKIISSHNSKAYQEFIGKLCWKFGAERISDLFINEVLPALSPEDFKWCYKTMLGQTGYERMKQEMMNTLSQMLIDKGYTPGKDFSINPEGGVILNNNASEALLADIPEDLRVSIRAEFKPITLPDALDSLEKHLGVPFRERLLQRVSDRLLSLSDNEAATYLAVMSCGFEDRTQIELFSILLSHVAEVYPERIQGILDEMKKPDDLDSSKSTHKVMLDLISAAGGEDELRPHPDHPNDPDEGLISRRGLEIFAQVWRGERSVYEVIAVLDRVTKKYQEQQ